MNIEESWKEINGGEDADLSKLLASANLSKLRPDNTLQKIKKNLLINIWWGLLICILYVFVIIKFQYWQVQAALIIVLVFTLWAIYTAWQEYKKTGVQISPANSMLDELKHHYNSLQRWMDIQLRVALFIYPISAAGGFMLGGAIGSNKPIAVFMGKHVVQIALVVTIAILVPACHWLAKWMFKISFGKCLKQLEQNIQQLEAEK